MRALGLSAVRECQGGFIVFLRSVLVVLVLCVGVSLSTGESCRQCSYRHRQRLVFGLYSVGPTFPSLCISFVVGSLATMRSLSSSLRMVLLACFSAPVSSASLRCRISEFLFGFVGGDAVPFRCLLPLCASPCGGSAAVLCSFCFCDAPWVPVLAPVVPTVSVSAPFLCFLRCRLLRFPPLLLLPSFSQFLFEDGWLIVLVVFVLFRLVVVFFACFVCNRPASGWLVLYRHG